MPEIMTFVAVTAAAFVGTNLDNLLLLVALNTRYARHLKLVSVSYITAMLLIAGTCLLIGEAGDFIPIAYLGLLGVIPIMTGVNSLVGAVRGTHTGNTNNVVIDSNHETVFITVLITQLSNSADSIITFSVLLADSSDTYDYLVGSVFLAMVFVFTWLGRYALKHKRFSGFLQRYGHWTTPFVLILVGIYILSNTASDLVPG